MLPTVEQPRAPPALVAVLEVEPANVADPGPRVVGLVPTREARAPMVDPEGARSAPPAEGVLGVVPAEQALAPAPVLGQARPPDGDAGLHAELRVARREGGRPAEGAGVVRAPSPLADAGVGRPRPGDAARCRRTVAGGPVLPAIAHLHGRAPSGAACPGRRPPAAGVSATAGRAALAACPPAIRSCAKGTRSPAARRGSRTDARCARGEPATSGVLAPRVLLRLAESPACSPAEEPAVVPRGRPAGAYRCPDEPPSSP